MIVGGSKCALAGGEHGPCGGRLDWHHGVLQQRLKRKFKYGAHWDGGEWVPASRYNAVTRSYFPDVISLADILSDTRNRVWLCRRHHELVHNGRVRLELPESVWAFAAEYGLTAQLENDLARRSAA